jgi:hypothetical protein
MPIILATWEAKIGKITVPGQPWQEVCGITISKEKNWAMVVAWTCHPSYYRKHK